MTLKTRIQAAITNQGADPENLAGLVMDAIGETPNRDGLIEIICNAPPQHTMGIDQAGAIADAILAHQQPEDAHQECPNKYDCKRCGGSGDEPEANPRTMSSVKEQAYGLLWMVIGDDPKIHEARKLLLSEIDKDGQKRGIEYAKSQYEMPPIESVLHKLP